MHGSRANVLVVAAALFAGSGVARAQSVTGASEIGLAIPAVSSSAGFVYRYNPALGLFERDASMSAQPFLERPEPVGGRRWNVNAAYLWFSPDQVDGADVVSDFDVHVLALGVSYGVTRDLEVNLSAPILYVDQGASSKGEFDPIFLRAKYRLVEGGPVQAAVGLVVRMLTKRLTDDDADMRVQASPLLYLASEPMPLGLGVQFRPYFNGGVNFDEDLRDLEMRWGLGGDIALSDRVTVATSVLGTHRVTDSPFTRATVDPRRSGIPFGRTDIVDATVGLRANVWDGKLTAFVHTVLPLNNDGLRADVIPLGGIEATF